MLRVGIEGEGRLTVTENGRADAKTAPAPRRALP